MLRKLLFGLLVVLLALVGTAYLLPREVSVSRSVVIDVPPAEVFPHLNDLRAFHEWSPWAGRDPAMEITFSGPERGAGQSMTWSSANDQVGSGTLTITDSTPDERVETALDFGDMGAATAEFRLEPREKGESTQVTWSFETDMGMNPLSRWMGLMMDSWVGEDYQQGLASLKARVEGG